MPTNRNASFRYRVINKCLKNDKRKWTLDDLIDEISRQMYEQFGNTKGISKRSVQYDLNIMRSDPPRGFAAPIVCENGFYSYTEKNYSIDNNPLNITDVENIKDAVDILKQFSDLPFYKELNNVLLKMESQYNSIENQIIYFENNQNLKNIESLENLYHLFKQKKVMRFVYQPYSKEPQEITVHPYILKEYRNRWFVIGYNNELKRFSVLPIDRIVNFDVLNLKTNYSFKRELIELLDNLIGVTIPPDCTKEIICFFVNFRSSQYLKTKPLHASQILIDENIEGSTFEIVLIPNYELEQIFLSFGENIQILSPESFRNKLKIRIDSMSIIYKNDNYKL